jgi:hypothetical protein
MSSRVVWKPPNIVGAPNSRCVAAVTSYCECCATPAPHETTATLDGIGLPATILPEMRAHVIV